MKEQTLLNMKHDLSKLVETTQHIINDLVMVRTIASGSLQTIKLMPGYDEAIAKLQAEETEKTEGINKLELND